MADVTAAILHPGEMGAAVGACARAHGGRVVWASEERSPATIERARAAGLTNLGTLEAVLSASDIVLSVCPPHGAVDQARAVAAAGFRGMYVDANAISPDTTREIGRLVESGGATFVDGGIVGPPPGPEAGARLYLSGKGAERVAELFSGGPPGGDCPRRPGRSRLGAQGLLRRLDQGHHRSSRCHPRPRRARRCRCGARGRVAAVTTRCAQEVGAGE